MSTPEGKVKDMVKKRMKQAYPNAYRFMPVQNGMGSPCLDFLYCVRGKFVGIETKRKGGKPTPRQDQTMAEIVEAGGLAFVVDCEEDMLNVVDQIDRSILGPVRLP